MIKCNFGTIAICKTDNGVGEGMWTTPYNDRDSSKYIKSPIYHKPRYTAAISFPQIGLNMYNVNKQNPDLPRMFSFPKLCGKSGFDCSTLLSSNQLVKVF